MGNQLRIPFAEPEEETRSNETVQEFRQSGRVAPARLSEDDYDLDPDRLEGDVA